ncbi:MAG: hypothetical protein LBP19_04945 [Treponema sp.]|jgi:hypothetical protein|nr:hypothetical protein [Treponema sp.]
MQISDATIIALIEQINDHYQANIASRFMRPLLLQLSIKRWVWDAIDSFTQNVSHFDYQRFNYEDLYRQIHAFAELIVITRRQLLPVLKGRTSGFAGADKTLMDMAINTFPSNLNLLADYTKQLYYKLVELGKTHTRQRKPMHLEYLELEDIVSRL